jgi:predicted SAM-dependent methyltransferase
VQYEKYLDIYLVENFSIYSEPDIKNLADELLAKGLIKKHIRFKENITNNAIQVCLNENLIDLENHDKVIITDGDVVSNNKNWIEELTSILDKHKNVFCVSPKMQTDKWIPHLKKSMAPVTQETDDYIVCGTGIWLCMFRTKELLDVMKIFKENGFRFADGRINEFARCVKSQHWVMAKRVEQEELNRSQELWNSEYQNNKQLLVNKFGGHHKLWNHDKVCICEIFTPEGKEVYTPQELFPPARERNEKIEDDYIVDIINKKSKEKPLQLFFDVPISSIKQGWVNLGVISPQRSFYESQSDTYYVNCYARAEKLPKFNSAFDMIYIYHSLNRSTDTESINILREIKNWLVNNGKIRIVVPSIQKILDIYLKKDFETLEVLKPFFKIPEHYVTNSFSDYLHWFLARPNIKGIYDQEKLEKLLEITNLPKPQLSAYQPEADVNGPIVAQFSDFYDINL